MIPTAKKSLSFVILISLFIAGCATVQQRAEQPETAATAASQATPPDTTLPLELDRPVPNSIDFEIPYAYKRSVRQGTRTPMGTPGEDYWQQKVDYDMDVELIPDEKRVTARSTITYHNNAPDSLNGIMLELAQNVHKEGVPRKENVEVTGGIEIKSVTVEGRELREITMQGQQGYYIDGTRMFLTLPSALKHGRSTQVEVEWAFKVPQKGAGGRMGYSEDNLFFIAYWYPKISVYDDVYGWFTDRFKNNAEFYHEFGDYSVDITAPEQWLVTSTGNLQNAGQVLDASVAERYRQAQQSDQVIAIVDSSDFGNITPSTGDGTLTWSFTAENINDFAFSVTKESVWEGARASVGDRDNDGQEEYTFVDAVYRLSAPKWKKAVPYAQHSITFFSDYLGMSYPWSHMTSIEGGGIIGGGMEFPMITIIGSYNYQPQESLYYVIAHEFAHMWIPMIVSTNERRYSWIDEGTTTFNENQARKDYFSDSGNPDINEFNSYTNIAGTYLEGPIMRWSDYHYPGPAFGVASYPKPGSGLVILRHLLGEKTFQKAYQTFLSEWKYKHPYPWDLFNIFEAVSGRDLDWFWRSFYYETWILDQAVGDVTSTANGTRIVIEDKGQMPLPATVEITLDNGETLTRHIEVDTWLRGNTSAELLIEHQAEVTGVQIDPQHHFPDVNRANNSWQK
ncbi:M1 family metallopeptidase [Halalkalibaculum sp. DA3122]|uniref:M1 family metallopeptidase n=1 Tax=Halalkalibaculum sp. DA3122 TaxID=3373607 RepID=UPI003754E8E3